MKIKMEQKGFDKVIDYLSDITDHGFDECAKTAIKKNSERIKTDMKAVAPRSKERDIHGVDAIDVSRMFTAKDKTFYYKKIGFSEMMKGHGADYWTQVRGLWYQNFKTDEPNFGWYDKFLTSNSQKYMDLLEDDFLFEIRKYMVFR